MTGLIKTLFRAGMAHDNLNAQSYPTKSDVKKMAEQKLKFQKEQLSKSNPMKVSL